MLRLMELELGLPDLPVGEGIGEILGFVISDWLFVRRTRVVPKLN